MYSFCPGDRDSSARQNPGCSPKCSHCVRQTNPSALLHRGCTKEHDSIQGDPINGGSLEYETRSYYRQASMRIHTMVVTIQRAGTPGRLRRMLWDIDKGELANRPSLHRRCWFSICCGSWTSQLWQQLELCSISRYLGPGRRPIQNETWNKIVAERFTLERDSIASSCFPSGSRYGVNRSCPNNFTFDRVVFLSSQSQKLRLI